MSDVGPDTRPVRGKIVIAYPALQVAYEQRRGNRLGRRKPQKIAAAQLHFGPEEIMIGRKQNWWVESDGNRHLLTGNGAFAPSKLIRARKDSVYDGIEGAKNGVYQRRASAQAVVEAIPRGITYLHVAW